VATVPCRPLITVLGFIVYWGAGWPVVAVVGLFVLGLGIAPLYPLAIGFAIEAVGPQGAAASARFMLAVGLSLLSMPALLGGLADEVGLGLAHLMVPGLVTGALVCLGIAKLLQRRSLVAAR
jgi:fucose permease